MCYKCGSPSAHHHHTMCPYDVSRSTYTTNNWSNKRSSKKDPDWCSPVDQGSFLGDYIEEMSEAFCQLVIFTVSKTSIIAFKVAKNTWSLSYYASQLFLEKRYGLDPQETHTKIKAGFLSAAFLSASITSGAIGISLYKDWDQWQYYAQRKWDSFKEDTYRSLPSYLQFKVN